MLLSIASFAFFDFRAQRRRRQLGCWVRVRGHHLRWGRICPICRRSQNSSISLDRGHQAQFLGQSAAIRRQFRLTQSNCFAFPRHQQHARSLASFGGQTGPSETLGSVADKYSIDAQRPPRYLQSRKLTSMRAQPRRHSLHARICRSKEGCKIRKLVLAAAFALPIVALAPAEGLCAKTNA
jgi:hypothetical protein